MRLSLPVTLTSRSLNETILKIRDRLDTTSQEAVTGQYADLTAHLSGRIGKAMLGQKALDDVQNERTQLTLKEGRLDIIQSTLGKVNDSINVLGVRMKAALGTGEHGTRETIVLDAKAALRQVFSVLNTRHGERYLFSGDATSTKPFSDSDTFLSDIRSIAAGAADAADFETQLDAYFNTPGAGWQANIYSGTATSSDPAGVTGMDPAITQIVSSLAIFALSGTDESLPLLDGNSPVIETATDRIANGQEALTTVRADRGNMQAQIVRDKDTLNFEETVLTNSLNQLVARDQYEAASELKLLESSLEASYTLTARLSNLSLLNFMR